MTRTAPAYASPNPINQTLFRRTLTSSRFRLIASKIGLGMLLLLVLLNIPHWPPPRLLTSGADSKSIDRTVMIPMDLRTGLQAKVIISYDAAEEIAIGAQTTRPDDMIAHEYRYPSVIAIPIGTHARKNNCILTMSLGGLKSDPVDCQQIKDNEAQPFTFSQKIKPGTYDVTLSSQTGLLDPTTHPHNFVAVYLYRGTSGNDQWLIPSSGSTRVTVGSALNSWAYRQPLRFFLYSLLIFAVLGTVLFAPEWTFASAFVGVYLGLILIWKPYSGYDETAHIDMLHTALADQPEAKKLDFWAQVRVDLINSSFHRLHNVTLNPGECPHQILASCGHSEPPLTLYRAYGTVLHRLFPPDKFQSPVFLRHLVLGIHGLQLLALLGFVLAFKNIALMNSVFFLLVFAGYISAQFPSITNDFPLIIYGLFSAVAASGVLTVARSKLAATIICLLLAGLFWPVSQVDHSSILALSFLPIIPLLWILTPQGTKKPLASPLRPTALVLGALILMVLAGFYSVQYGVVGNPAALSLLTTHFSQTFTNLTHLLKFENPMILGEHLLVYGKSVIGSYVWGHDYLFTVSYLVGGGLLVALFGRGVYLLVMNSHLKKIRWLTFLALSLSLTLLLCGILSAFLVGVGSIEIIRDSFLKPRFSAAGLGVLLFPILWGAYTLMPQEKLRHNLGIMTALWSLCLLGYYFPRFFILDLY